MTGLRIALCSLIAGALLSSWATVNAQPKTKLKPQTVEAFDNYIKEIEEEYAQILGGKKPFLWANSQDKDVQERARQGEIVVIKERENVNVPNGIIHVWGVLAFLPDATAEKVVKLLQNYDRHKDIYPSVADSKLLDAKGDTVNGYLQFKYKKVLTAVLNTEHESKLTRLDEGKYALHVKSTRISEVVDQGKSSEKELPVGEDSGFMWRLNTYWGVRFGNLDPGHAVGTWLADPTIH